jgi:hypothetical protein
LNLSYQKKEKDALHQLSYLVYWYGATEEDTRMYGFVTPRTFIPYDVEKAKPKSACNLPERIQSKIGSSEGGTAVDATTTAASNPPLNAKDTITLRAYREVQEDLLKEPSERKRGLYRNANDDDDNNDHDEKAPRRRKKGIPAVDPNDVRAVKSHQRRQSK